ncbi:hypothetical protein G5I_13119 [Acromyrmex echinatior]|uniref:Uncharacterized protein n=1 Tax=Acromyrmex echinatior TaxID=103372 RepID=F4X461_ACREC|nr:hypothetical protein G5I_13119 [Acromyrmex echinatior]
MLQVREEKIEDSKLANLGFPVLQIIKKSGRNKQSEAYAEIKAQKEQEQKASNNREDGGAAQSAAEE